MHYLSGLRTENLIWDPGLVQHSPHFILAHWFLCFILSFFPLLFSYYIYFSNWAFVFLFPSVYPSFHCSSHFPTNSSSLRVLFFHIYLKCKPCEIKHEKDKIIFKFLNFSGVNWNLVHLVNNKIIKKNKITQLFLAIFAPRFYCFREVSNTAATNSENCLFPFPNLFPEIGFRSGSEQAEGGWLAPGSCLVLHSLLDPHHLRLYK